MSIMHPRDHVKTAAEPGDQRDLADELGPSRDLHAGHQRNLYRGALNFDDEPITDGPFLHRALDRRPEEFSYGAPAGERLHLIDQKDVVNWNSPPWFQMLGQR